MFRKQFLLFYFFLNVLNAEGQITYQKLITSNNRKLYGNSMCAVPNNTFAITGKVTDYTDNLLKMFVLLIDENGDTLWTKLLKDTADIYGESIVFTVDGSLALTGRKGGEVIFIKMDLQGNILISEIFTPPPDFFLYQSKIINAVDSGYLVQGAVVNDNGFGNQFIFKLNNSGIMEWSRTYYNTDNSVWKLIPCDSGYVWYGTNYFPMIIKLNLFGDFLWSIKYDFMIGPSVGYEIVERENGGYIMSGEIDHYPTVDWVEGFLIQVDSGGNFEWAKGYGYPYNSLAISNIIPRPDKSYSLVGLTDVATPFLTSIANIDSTGNLNWMKAFKTWYPNLGSRFKAIETDGKEIMVSTTGMNLDLGFSWLSLYLIKADSLGNTGCFDTTATINSRDLFPIQHTIMFADSSLVLSSQLINFISDSSFNVNNFCFSVNLNEVPATSQVEIRLTPNPFHTTAKLKLNHDSYRDDISEMRNYAIKIYNTLGILVREEKILNLNSYVLHRDGLNDGMYFFELRNNRSEFLGSGKFIVE